MKKLLILLLMLSASTLLLAKAPLTLKTYYVQQYQVTEEMQDDKLTHEELKSLVQNQQKEIDTYIIELISNKEHTIKELTYNFTPEILQLNRKIHTNNALNNIEAVDRDTIAITTYHIKQNINDLLADVLSISDSLTTIEFNKQLNNILKKFQDAPGFMDESRYDEYYYSKSNDPITISIKHNLLDYKTAHTIFTNILTFFSKNQMKVHQAILLSKYQITTFNTYVNEFSSAQQINPTLAYIGLDSAKVVMILFILVSFLIFKYFLLFVTQFVLGIILKDKSDIEYVILKTKRIFTMFTLFLMFHILLLIYSGFILSERADHFISIIYVLIIAIMIYRLINTSIHVMSKHMQNRLRVRNEVINLSLKVANIFILSVAIMFILSIMGVNMTAILSGLGIGGVAVAFAAKDTIANFFGSISILLSDLFEQGDWIEVDGFEGTVVELGLRATTIRTFDNALIAIPNFKLADNGIKNWSRRSVGRRIRMHIGVTYGSDFEDIKKAIEDIRQMIKENPLIISDTVQSRYSHYLVKNEDLEGIKNTSLIYLDEFGASSINILIYCFSKSVVWNEWLEAKEDVMYKIADILKANNLEFAFPTMSIHLENKDREIID